MLKFPNLAVEWSRNSYSEPAKSNLLWCESTLFLVLFNDWGGRVSSRFHIFVSDVNQGNEEAG